MFSFVFIVFFGTREKLGLFLIIFVIVRKPPDAPFHFISRITTGGAEENQAVP